MDFPLNSETATADLLSDIFGPGLRSARRPARPAPVEGGGSGRGTGIDAFYLGALARALDELGCLQETTTG